MMESPYVIPDLAGGQFRIKLVLSKDFPASPPKGFFLTKIFHPNVAKHCISKMFVETVISGWSHWRDMCEHTEKGLDTRSWDQTHPAGQRNT